MSGALIRAAFSVPLVADAAGSEVARQLADPVVEQQLLAVLNGRPGDPGDPLRKAAVRSVIAYAIDGNHRPLTRLFRRLHAIRMSADNLQFQQWLSGDVPVHSWLGDVHADSSIGRLCFRLTWSVSVAWVTLRGLPRRAFRWARGRWARAQFAITAGLLGLALRLSRRLHRRAGRLAQRDQRDQPAPSPVTTAAVDSTFWFHVPPPSAWN